MSFSKPGLYLHVTADTNDGDYVHSTTKLKSEDEITKFLPLIKAIKNFESYEGLEYYPGRFMTHDHNFPTSEVVRDDLGELSGVEYYVKQGLGRKLVEEFDEKFVPYGQRGIHTIESIKLIEVKSIKDLLK